MSSDAKHHDKKIDDEEDDSIKVILVGEAGTGKTSLINSVQGKTFTPGEQLSSMTCSFVKVKRNILDIPIKINLWDTIGQEKFRSLTKLFLNGSKIVIFVFDITQKETFTALDYWIETINSELGTSPIRGLAANKQDLFDKQTVDDQTIQEYADKNGIPFALTSAMNPQSFITLLDGLIEKYLTTCGEFKRVGKKLKRIKKKKSKLC